MVVPLRQNVPLKLVEGPAQPSNVLIYSYRPIYRYIHAFVVLFPCRTSKLHSVAWMIAPPECAPYVLNTQSEEKNAIFYSYSACFVNTLTVNMYVSMPYYRVQQADYVICIRVAAPQEYIKAYSTCRLRIHHWRQQTNVREERRLSDGG